MDRKNKELLSSFQGRLLIIISQATFSGRMLTQGQCQHETDFALRSSDTNNPDQI